MNRKKTHEEYVEELKIKNPNIEVIDMYIDYKTPILHRCKIHNIEWYINPANALGGKSCKLCKGDKIKNSKRMSDDEYIKRLSVANPYVEIVGQYVNANTPVMHRCKIHDITWMTRPADALKGKGCQKCHIERFSKSKSKTHIEYITELAIKNTNIEVIGMYVKAKIPIAHRCKICGHQWDASPDNILHGAGCPICNISHGEKEICDYLNNMNVYFIPQHTFNDCRNKKLLPFDFYLPEYNLCIEYDGIQHFEPVEYFGGIDALERCQHNDAIKNNYCLLHNIRLLRIRYDKDIKTELNNFFNSIKLIKGVV